MRARSLFLALFLVGCGGARGAEKPIANVVIPVRDPTQPPTSGDDDTREDPPESDPARPPSFPAVVRERLANGVELLVAPTKGAPIAEVRVVVSGAGTAADGDRTGLAALAAALAFEGGAGKMSPREQAEKTGLAALRTTTRLVPDALEIAAEAPKEKVADVLDLVAQALAAPKLDAQEFAKLKKRERARRADEARGDAGFVGRMLLARELFKLPTSVHPYASWDATPAEIDKLQLADVKAFAKQAWVPASVTIVVAGDVDRADVRAACERSFGAWKGPEPAALSITDPVLPDAPHVLVADVPGAPAADVFVGSLATDRQPDEWVALLVATDVLGGGPSSHLASALADVDPMGASARATLGTTAHGPLPLAIHARVPAAKTGLAVATILEVVHRFVDAAPSDADVASSKKRLEASLALRQGDARGIASALAETRFLAFPDDLPEKLATHLRAVDAAAVSRVSKSLATGLVVVVVGDASTVAPLVRRVSDVMVVAPEKGFSRLRTLPADAQAPLEPAKP